MNMIELVCDECNRPFTRSNGEHARNKRIGREFKFCSRTCHNRNPLAHGGRAQPPVIPWLKPRNWQEQALGEMICGAALEFQKCQANTSDQERLDQHCGEDYWNGYWAALIDYGRRIFEVRNYSHSGGNDDNQKSTATEEDGARPVSAEALS